MGNMDGKISIAIVARIKQGDIYSALEGRGWSVRQAAEFVGVNSKNFYDMMNLKRVPSLTLEQELKMFELTGKTMEELFPQEFREQEFLCGKRVFTALGRCDPQQLASSGMRCLSAPLSTSEEDLLDAAQSFLSKLADFEREVLEMRIDGKTFGEISEILGFNERYVKLILQRVRTRLRYYVADYRNRRRP